MNQIRRYRELSRLNQKRFACECGWEPSRLSNYENNISTPSICNSKKILEVLSQHGVDCTLDDLYLDREGDLK